MRRNTSIIGLIAGLLLSLALVQPASAAPAFRALLFTKTAGYRHDSIPAGVSMFQQQAAANNFELVHSEDSNVFTPANLATFDVLIMFQTSGMVWTSAAQRQAVEGFLASGKGIVAIHNATDMGIEAEYPWWDQTVNAGAHMPEHSPAYCPAPQSSPTRSTRRQPACRTAGTAARSGTTSTRTRAATCTSW